MESADNTISSPLFYLSESCKKVRYGGKVSYRRGVGRLFLMSFDQVQGTSTTLMVFV